MKKHNSLILISTILFIDFVCAKFSLSEIPDYIKPEAFIFVLVFAVSFLLLFLFFNKLIESNNTTPTILALLLSSGVVFGVYKLKLDFDGLISNIGVSESTIYILIPAITLAALIFSFAKIGKKTFLVLAGLSFLISFFVENKPVFLGAGVIFTLIWLISLIKRGAREPRDKEAKKVARIKKKRHNQWEKRKRKRDKEQTEKKPTAKMLLYLLLLVGGIMIISFLVKNKSIIIGIGIVFGLIWLISLIVALLKGRSKEPRGEKPPKKKNRKKIHKKWTKRKNRRNKKAQRQTQRTKKLRHSRWVARKGYRNVKQKIAQGTNTGKKKFRHTQWTARKKYRNMKKQHSEKQTEEQQRRQRLQALRQQAKENEDAKRKWERTRKNYRLAREIKSQTKPASDAKRQQAQEAKKQKQQQTGKQAIIDEKRKQLQQYQNQLEKNYRIAKPRLSGAEKILRGTINNSDIAARNVNNAKKRYKEAVGKKQGIHQAKRAYDRAISQANQAANKYQKAVLEHNEIKNYIKEIEKRLRKSQQYKV